MQRRRTKPLRGGPTAPSPMEIEWLDPRLLDAPGEVFGVTEGSSRGHVGVAMRQAEDETRGVPTPPLEGGRFRNRVWHYGNTERGVTSSSVIMSCRGSGMVRGLL